MIIPIICKYYSYKYYNYKYHTKKYYNHKYPAARHRGAGSGTDCLVHHAFVSISIIFIVSITSVIIIISSSSSSSSGIMFRDGVFQDVGFQNAMFQDVGFENARFQDVGLKMLGFRMWGVSGCGVSKPLSHFSFRCEVPTPCGRNGSAASIHFHQLRSTAQRVHSAFNMI